MIDRRWMAPLGLLGLLLFADLAVATREAKEAVPAPVGDPAAGEAPSPEEAAAMAEFAALDSLRYRNGKIEIGSKLAVLDVPPAFGYVGPEDSARILRAWGNPVEEPPLGMLFPSGETPMSEGAWAIVLQWSADGHVKDDDANDIDYTKMLAEMKEATAEENEEREKAGFATVEVVGWAAPPRYDAATHKLFWAKELRFGGEPENTLNYNMRMLGRRGVLVLNAVAPMSRLSEIEAATPAILAMVDFLPGERYADFDPSTDSYASYGLAALVAGGVGAKAGLFKGLIAVLLAAKKFVIIGLIAVGSFAAKLFGKKRESASPADDSTPIG